MSRFRAYVQVIDEPQFADSTWQGLRQEVRALDEHAAVLFVVDGPAEDVKQSETRVVTRSV